MASLAGQRLMVLGAGVFQASGIRKAAAAGCHVITVDNVPGNPGHAFGHEFVNCSTTDRDGVLHAARTRAIDGICTFSSDVAIPAVAHACEQLQLSGPSLHAAQTMAFKHRFRAFARDAGLPHPRFVAGNSLEELLPQLSSLRWPAMVKPVDTSGSRGVARVESPGDPALPGLFERARQFSPSGTVCIEEFVAGTEVGGDAILVDGRIGFGAITQKYLDGVTVTGHRLPAAIGTPLQQAVFRQLESVCAALGYTHGPLNFDAMVDGEAVTVLEMSARNGGNGIASVIARATGVDVEDATIRLALGQAPDLAAQQQRGAASLVFGSPRAGRIGQLRDEPELRERVPELLDVHFAKRRGDAVAPFEHNGNLVGFAVFDCTDAADYSRIKESIHVALDLAVLS